MHEDEIINADNEKDDDEIYLDEHQSETENEEEAFCFASEKSQTKDSQLYQMWYYDTFKNQFKIDLDDAFEAGSKKNNQLRKVLYKSILQLENTF